EPMVLVSDLSDRKPVKSIQVRLVGVDSNRDGLGSRVVVFADGKTFVQAHDGQSGYLSQSRMPLYFGLGSAESVDKIEVTWPTGKTQVHPGPIPATGTVVIEEAG
ncbi:MAG TPA: hypothetical protein DCE43_05050, partial [Planctomycetaceae bacterium]|nr:hypothetical protein [Planctomycetaceae bacterium]